MKMKNSSSSTIRQIVIFNVLGAIGAALVLAIACIHHRVTRSETPEQAIELYQLQLDQGQVSDVLDRVSDRIKVHQMVMTQYVKTALLALFFPVLNIYMLVRYARQQSKRHNNGIEPISDRAKPRPETAHS